MSPVPLACNSARMSAGVASADSDRAIAGRQQTTAVRPRVLYARARTDEVTGDTPLLPYGIRKILANTMLRRALFSVSVLVAIFNKSLKKACPFQNQWKKDSNHCKPRHCSPNR